MKSDYKPSAHLVGEKPRYEPTLRDAFIGAVIAAIIVLFSFAVSQDAPAVSCDKPAPTAQK